MKKNIEKAIFCLGFQGLEKKTYTYENLNLNLNSNFSITRFDLVNEKKL